MFSAMRHSRLREKSMRSAPAYEEAPIARADPKSKRQQSRLVIWRSSAGWRRNCCVRPVAAGVLLFCMPISICVLIIHLADGIVVRTIADACVSGHLTLGDGI